jgi:hypothetical protein
MSITPCKKIILFLTFVASTVFMTFGGSKTTSTDFEDVPTEELFILESDSISQENPLRIRLQDPNYDVRFERGSLQPWHDIRSIYLRRTIPVMHLAATKKPDSIIPILFYIA